MKRRRLHRDQSHDLVDRKSLSLFGPGNPHSQNFGPDNPRRQNFGSGNPHSQNHQPASPSGRGRPKLATTEANSKTDRRWKSDRERRSNLGKEARGSEKELSRKKAKRREIAISSALKGETALLADENEATTNPELQYFTKKNVFRFLVAFVLVDILTGSGVLAMPIALIAFAAPTFRDRRRNARLRLELINSWPEILDIMISGLHSGLSIAETIHGLADRGPEATRELFAECREELFSSGDLSRVFRLIKFHFNDAMADQVCEVLDFARSTGSRDTTLTLRTLGEYIRSEIALREEIRVKHGWIRNSAAVASVAPWILLAVLSLQPNTIRAYSSGAGVLVLMVGVGMCSAAFLWMNRVGRMPEIPRVFK